MGNSTLRHTACKSCRDRKVRCGGEQPSCAKCRRAGDECIYMPTQRPTREYLTQTVEALQQRLSETEARIAQLSSKDDATATVAIDPPSFTAPWSPSLGNSGPSAVFHCPLSPFLLSGHAGGPPVTQTPYSMMSMQPDNVYSPGTMGNDFLDSLRTNSSSGRLTDQAKAAHMEDEEDPATHPSPDVDMISGSQDVSTSQLDKHDHQRGQEFSTNVTGLTELHGSAGTSLSSTMLPDTVATMASTSTSRTTEDRASKTNAGTNTAIATALADFSSSVLYSHAEVAGMAQAVADYIAWMRKVPAGGETPPNTSLIYTSMLEAIESRLREIREIAQTRPRAAVKDLVTGLEAIEGPVSVAMRDGLASHENEFDRRSADVVNFFKTRYNACIALSEQARHASPAASTSSRPDS